MYIPGTIFYFKPFYFIEGGSRRKYFITLYNAGGITILAALPSSQDYVPSQITKQHGCLNYPDGDFNAYYFSPAIPITTDGWCFPTHTFVYGNWIKYFDLNLLQTTYQVESTDYDYIGRLTREEYNEIIQCLLKARTMKNKIRRLLEKASYDFDANN